MIGRIQSFEQLYLGTRDSCFGEYMRNIYSEDVCDTYWKERFGCSRIGTLGFNKNIKEYLLWGFELENYAASLIAETRRAGLNMRNL